MKEILRDTGIELVDIKSLNVDVSVAEDGKTFEENALKKAYAYHVATGLPCMADDSGLEVDCLNGEPGVYTARYAGEKATDKDNIAKLLYEMRSVPRENRSARFVCAIALVLTDGTVIITKASCEGIIAFEERGNGGFGYDPVFYVPEYKKTFAELDEEVKNHISHRAKALAKMKRYLEKLGVIV